MASNVALGAPARVLSAEGKHIAAVAAPVGADVGDGGKSVRDAMVELLLVRGLSKIKD